MHIQADAASPEDRGCVICHCQDGEETMALPGAQDQDRTANSTTTTTTTSTTTTSTIMSTTSSSTTSSTPAGPGKFEDNTTRL